ncbi:MAG TPA: hypothetical protein VFD92_22710 [Candidatus Binatia bacterium]|nr:hypothetical protein [Candidatus Binatia bacterium]
MTRPSAAVGVPEPAYVRNVIFALELVDAITLARVHRGLEVTAEGLDGLPIVNASGLFVWLEEEDALERLERITVDPGLLPYRRLEIARDDLELPLTTRVLLPDVAYPFGTGVTGLRGALIEERGAPSVPIVGAEVWLQWLDDGDVWRDAPTRSSTDAHGDFAAILQFSSDPKHDASGALVARLRARRSPTRERHSDPIPLLQGRVADPATFAAKPDALVFAWDEMDS